MVDYTRGVYTLGRDNVKLYVDHFKCKQKLFISPEIETDQESTVTHWIE